MPANPKYLSSPGHRILKITAGILGGYLISVLFHNAIGSMLEEKGALIITTGYTSFIVWAAMLIFAFMGKNGWKVWGLYLLLIALLAGVIFLNK
jgi:hypothetical protein